MAAPISSLKLVALIIITVAVAFFAIKYPSLCTTDIASQHTSYSEYECAGKPHQSSWGSWWHPQRTWSGADAEQKSGQGAGTVTKDWNILYHLGGNGPWIEKKHNVVERGIEVPKTCAVDQVHMMSRHAERYPTIKVAASGFLALPLRCFLLLTIVYLKGWRSSWTRSSRAISCSRATWLLSTIGSFSGQVGHVLSSVHVLHSESHLSHRNYIYQFYCPPKITRQLLSLFITSPILHGQSL
jgi:acid phosphatase